MLRKCSQELDEGITISAYAHPPHSVSEKEKYVVLQKEQVSQHTMIRVPTAPWAKVPALPAELCQIRHNKPTVTIINYFAAEEQTTEDEAGGCPQPRASYSTRTHTRIDGLHLGRL